MATQYKTRCPHCAAQFKISDNHLKQARGAVRCGSCLQIFQATDYLLDGPAPSPTAESATENRWAGALDHASESSADDTDLIDDGSGEDDGLTIKGMEFSDSFMNLDSNNDTGLGEDFSDMEGAGRHSHDEHTDEAWAEALLKELEDDPEPSSPSDSDADTETETQKPKTRAVRNQPEPQPAQRQGHDATPTARPDSAASHQTEHDDGPEEDDEDLFAGLDLFGDGLDTEPAQVKYNKAPPPAGFHRQRDWPGIAKWSSLALLALLTLAGQYAFFHLDQLARTPQWRPFYAQACELIGCRLPSRSDVSQLRATNMIVTSHPDYQDALLVEATLFNEADYRQPFPQLELSFTALDGSAVASRRFHPREYLQGELTHLDTMPRSRPLTISLEIVDLGDQAVNYNLRLLPTSENGASAG